MSESYFEAYGSLAEAGLTPTQLAGRYGSQARAERLIGADVEKKLGLTPDTTLLEIGCGPGNLLLPLSFRVAQATGLDHPRIVEKARLRFADARVHWIGGEFPNVKLEPGQDRFDAILIYSVMHYVADMESALAFCDAATRLLAPGGRMLIGDMPNVDRKRRFLASDAGIAFDAEWRRSQAAHTTPKPGGDPFEIFNGCKSIGGFTDVDLLRLLAHFRARGLHAYLLAQPADLPFGHTREDILVVKP